MNKRLHIDYDDDLIEELRASFDLRAPNREALDTLARTLAGDYDPKTMQVLNLATGVGKTYLMAAFIEYLRRKGVGNVVIVTPGKVVQAKTVQNFLQGSLRYIPGAAIPPDVVTPQDDSAWTSRQNNQTARLAYGREAPSLAFIFNIQQLIAPKSQEGDTQGASVDAQRRKSRVFDEHAGKLFDYLKELDDLVLIADESHLYSASAEAFHAAIRELDPAALVGLTASVLPEDHVIYKYPLYRAIADRFVKAPVLAFRKDGYTSEEQQLRDALQLRNLKQAHYDNYAERHSLPHLNAIVFVVCSDVEHATQIATLLRSPEYLGRDDAVLQVDSEHDDELTQKRLDRLDAADSPVLAVVSVNKLKEGWDVKNIAVVVTLRAMASEVLTQQTMGRGLRLPFGKYTDSWQIDQLDIISHQSFQKLLTEENVLAQFGLDEAVPDKDRDKIGDALRKAAGLAGDGHQSQTGVGTGGATVTVGGSGAEAPVGSPESSGVTGELFAGETTENGAGGGLGVRVISDTPDEETLDLTPVTIQRNPRFADVGYAFPVTNMEIRQPPIDLSEIEDHDISDAAKRVTSTGDVLFRKEIIAALGKKLRTKDAESAEVDSLPVPDAEAADALVRLVMDFSLVPKTPTSVRCITDYLVPRFMKGVTFTGWTVKSLDSARRELHNLVNEYIGSVIRAEKHVPVIRPKTMNPAGYMLPLGEKVYEQIDSRAEFVRGRVYSGWRKSLFAEESFDSWSGEYELARLLDISPSIRWWHRLQQARDSAYIHYTAKDRYYPDFVACDTQDVYWIIEGKSQRGQDDATVQAKRKAAETLVRRLVAEDAFAGQHWGYLIAYEDDIKRADSWEDLKTFSQPVSNAL